MLLEFKIKNYKSFVEQTTFSMIAAPRQKGLDYSLFKEKVKGKTVTSLCSSVIYGSNASGKTNIICTMDTFRSIVLKGNIKDSEEVSSFNPASSLLTLIPNNTLTVSQPTEFYIDFIENNFRIQYSICIDLGIFIEDNYPRKIVAEKLIVNNGIVFDRTEHLNLVNLKVIRKYLNFSKPDKQNLKNMIEIAERSLNSEELFLTNGFKTIFSQSFVKLIYDWFMNKFIIIYRADSLKFSKNENQLETSIYNEKTMNKAAKLFGINSNDICYKFDDNERNVEIYSILKGKENIAIPSRMFESHGTIHFINIFPLIAYTINKGGILIVDEFDVSIHPLAIMSIINIFHNNDINIHHAQLIFNTHNPIFLNSNTFRRDEIKFVERDDTNHCSTLYSLSDFGTSGKQGVRKNEDYMKNYLVNKYGAIKDIDFTPIFEEIIKSYSYKQK